VYGVILGSDLLIEEPVAAKGWSFSYSTVLPLFFLLLVDRQIPLPAQQKSSTGEKVGALWDGADSPRGQTAPWGTEAEGRTVQWRAGKKSCCHLQY